MACGNVELNVQWNPLSLIHGIIVADARLEAADLDVHSYRPLPVGLLHIAWAKFPIAVVEDKQYSQLGTVQHHCTV